MKKLFTLSGIVFLATLGTPCLAQSGRTIDPIPSNQGENYLAAGITGNSSANKKAVSEAEISRSLQQARKLKALKSAMAEVSYHNRKPVISNASQFLEYNKPSAPATNKPYLVPETYPRSRADVPAVRSGESTEKKRETTTEESESNPYSYPGRVSESGDSPPEVTVASNNTAAASQKKRPSFFKWMKNRKTGKNEKQRAVSESPAPLILESSPSARGTLEAPAPPEMETTSPIESPSGPAPQPSAMAIPAETAGNSRKSNRGGFLKDLFRKKE